MELVRDGDDHGPHVRVGEHRVVVCVQLFGVVGRRHPPQQVFRHVADGVEPGVPGLAAGLEVGGLRDLARPQHSHSELA